MKLVKVKTQYQDKKTGETKQSFNYYVVLENGSFISIKPSFTSDYNLLKVLAETVDKIY